MFFKRDLYPNIGNLGTTEQTIPEAVERMLYNGKGVKQEADARSRTAIANIPIIIAVVIGVIVLLIWKKG